MQSAKEPRKYIASLGKVSFLNLLLTMIRICLTSSHITNPTADGTMRFAVDLYKVLCSAQKNENILYSPLGTASALGMVHLGAKGKTHNEISQLLNLKNDSYEAFAPLQTLFSVTSKRKEFTFNLANALYLQEGFMVKEQYLHSNKEFFRTAIKLVNFQDTQASAEAISTWVENKTEGQIKNFISSEDLGPLTRLLLVNAIYFKGNWKQAFKAETTSLMDFTKSDGSIISVPMMHLQLRTRLGHFSDCNVSYQVLELPYKGDEFSLVLILPAEDVPIEEVENLITAELIEDWFVKMEEDDEVEISLPRFKIEQKLDMKETLKTLNVIEIFNNGCDLSGLTDSADVHISQAIQKVCIEVNEDGSEAAALTGMHVAAIMSMTPHQFVANRPFLFILKHNSTGSIIFMGKLASPDGQFTKKRDTDSL
ncbi:serpin I2 isoform X2 [Sphaerodactylus townsendi]|uniref:serpin I2 isoform X2 n=1 Tax=Sphaerodactylus townsendi TaxID=933632 RepID=UPI002026B01A|nr:serpin I2 isoform X2 [Sphaerodactylus townsendi]